MPPFCLGNFGVLFSPLQNHFVTPEEVVKEWSQYLVTAAWENNVDGALVKGLRPTPSFPRPWWWEKNREQLRGEDYDCAFSDVCGCNSIRFMTFSDNFVPYDE